MIPLWVKPRVALDELLREAWRPFAAEVVAELARAGATGATGPDTLEVRAETITLMRGGVETLVLVRRLFAGVVPQ